MLWITQLLSGRKHYARLEMETAEPPLEFGGHLPQMTTDLPWNLVSPNIPLAQEKERGFKQIRHSVEINYSTISIVVLLSLHIHLRTAAVSMSAV